VPPVPPVVIPEAAAEEMMGPEFLLPGVTLGIAPSLMPTFDLARLPPQLTRFAPPPVPVVPPPPVVQEAPPVYVPPLRPRKQDRN
jgi:hypothetical protein